MGGKVATLLAKFIDRHIILVLALGAVLFLDLPFNRQTVAIPARHIIAVKAAHLERAGDDVLEDLVERMANVQMTIGVRRSVVQHIFLAVFCVFTQALIKIHLVPAGDNFRLFFRQTGPHGVVGFRQVAVGDLVV